METKTLTPIPSNQRADILDILRGFALLGICLANYPAISMYVFQKPEVMAAMPTATIDTWVEYFHLVFIEGKFYSLFSLLFGIGFSIFLLRAKQAGKGLNVFYKRIFILLIIGLMHSLLLWEGDILLLYALIGLILSLFRNVPDKKLIILWAVLILSPIIIDGIKVITDNQWNLSKPLERLGMAIDEKTGITEDNWRTWNVDHSSYSDLFRFNQSGIIYRYMGLVDSNRFFKVLGMFLLGLYAGRKLLYRNLDEHKTLFRKVQFYGYVIGIPLSVAYAYFDHDENRLPHALGLLDTVCYALSVVPLSLAYTASICLLFTSSIYRKRLDLFAAPGKMALTNYIMQTVIGIILFYGIGFGLGATMGVVYVIFIALAVFAFQVFYSHWWLKHFNYGPLEWIWRQLTYGKILPLKKAKPN